MPVFVIVLLCLAGALLLSDLLFAVAMICKTYLRHPPAPDPTAEGFVFEGKFANLLRPSAVGRKWFLSQQPTPLTVTSRDGLRLCARYLPAERPVRTVILVHGYTSKGENDFGLSLKKFHEEGCNLLLIDQRTHGDSEGKFICFGTKERYDLLLWIEEMRKLSPAPIYLHGLSMGATTVMLAAGLKLPSQVVGVIADCGFTSAWDQDRYILKRDYHLPAIPILPTASLLCRLIAGWGFREADTRRSLAECGIPVLFIHGDRDDFVPTEMSRQNYAACAAPKKLVIVHGAWHAECAAVDPELYYRSVLDFWRAVETGTPVE